MVYFCNLCTNKKFLFSILGRAIKKVDYENYSWVINSYFDYKHPRLSIMNLAYPSAIAYYYLTVIPSNKDYTLYGKFFKRGVFEISLTVYYDNGNINEQYSPITSYNHDGPIEYNIINNTNRPLYVIQRFYVNMDLYTETDLINGLLKVYDNKSSIFLPILPRVKRNICSRIITYPYERIISHVSHVTFGRFTKFFLPSGTNGLFADKNHYYLLSLPGKYKLLKITGKYDYSKEIPYIDFITVNQITSETENGLPFYKFVDKGKYELYIASNELSQNYLSTRNINKNIIYFNCNNFFKGIIFRMINYSYKGIAQHSGPLTPEQTEKIMVSGFYPYIEPII